jgi:hypothetical protein
MRQGQLRGCEPRREHRVGVAHPTGVRPGEGRLRPRRPARLQRRGDGRASLTRWAAVSRQSAPRAVKNSPAGPPPPSAALAARGALRAGAAGSGTVPWTVRVQPLHPVTAQVAPVSLAVSAGLRAPSEPDGQAWELVLKYGNGGVVEVVADQAQVQVPALRAAVGSLDPGRDDARVARRDVAAAASRSRQVRTVRPTARCSGPAWPPTGTRPCRQDRRGWPSRRARTCTHSTAACPSAGTGARFSTQEIASTLTVVSPVIPAAAAWWFAASAPRPTGHSPGTMPAAPRR